MSILSQLLNTKRAVLEYGDYYSSYRKELISILSYYKEKNCNIAIWGAGLKGRAFLSCIDKTGEYIQYVTDLNKELEGSNITKHHKVYSLQTVLDAKPEVMIIMNKVHYADNYALLRDRNFKGVILDLDYLIEHKIDPLQITSGAFSEEPDRTDVDMDKVHGQLLIILKEIDRICKKHNITYFLSAGSALGAIRHKGFIPWDDDADIGMLREDFERFRKIVREELGDEFYYQRLEKGSAFYRAFDQIGKKNTSYVMYNVKDLRIHHGIHVDIFPFDYVSADPDEREKQVREVLKVREEIFKKLVPHVVETRNILKRLVINYEYYIMKFVPLGGLIKRMEHALCKNIGKDYEYLADLLTHYKKIMYFKKTDILPVTYTKFEDSYLPVPNNTDAYLTMMYGDYQTPPPSSKRNQHHRIIELSCDKAYYKDEALLRKEKD